MTYCDILNHCLILSKFKILFREGLKKSDFYHFGSIQECLWFLVLCIILPYTYELTPDGHLNSRYQNEGFSMSLDWSLPLIETNPNQDSLYPLGSSWRNWIPPIKRWSHLVNLWSCFLITQLITRAYLERLTRR